MEARQYLAGLRNAAIQANDVDEAHRRQNLINELDHHAFDTYTAALANAEAAHAQTPAKLPSSIDANALAERLSALGDEHFVRMNDESIAEAKQHEASKLSSIYMLAAQDVAQGLDPLVHVRNMLDSGLDEADTAVYVQASSEISAALSPGTAASVRPTAARSLWARAGEIASALLAALRRGDPRPGDTMAHVDSVAAVPGPIRFLDSPPGHPSAATDPPPGTPVRSVEVDAGAVAGGTGSSSAGSGSTRARHSVGVRALPSRDGAHLEPTLDGDGAHWKEPAVTREDAAATPWANPS